MKKLFIVLALLFGVSISFAAHSFDIKKIPSVGGTSAPAAPSGGVAKDDYVSFRESTRAWRKSNPGPEKLSFYKPKMEAYDKCLTRTKKVGASGQELDLVCGKAFASRDACVIGVIHCSTPTDQCSPSEHMQDLSKGPCPPKE